MTAGDLAVRDAAATAPHDALTVAPFTGTAAEWDAFVRVQTGWTHFHLAGWRAVVERAFGHACPYLAARTADGRLAGVLPLVRVRSALFGHYMMSMPFLNYGGPLGSDAAVRALAAAAADDARASGAKLLEMRSAVPLPLDLPVSHRKVTVILELAPDPDVVWNRFDSKLRSQIRRPQKDGCIARAGLDQVDAFYRVFSEHMRDLGTPVLPRALFNEIAREFANSARLIVAYLNDEPVATGLGFQWGDEFEITWASSLLAHKRSVSPNMLVYWELIKACAESGVARFNFGRCTPGGGTHKFKLQWGGRDTPLHWYQRSTSPNAKTPSPDDAAYAWGPRLWKKLPLSLANALGPRIVKYIP